MVRCFLNDTLFDLRAFSRSRALQRLLYHGDFVFTGNV